MGMINHFDTFQFPEVKPDKTYSYPEFRKKVISIFKTPHLTHVNINELMSPQQKPDESFLEYMGRVQDNVAKAFPKLADANRQDLAVSILFQGLRDKEVARKTANQAKGDVASALRIATSATAFGKNQHYFQRYEPSRRRYHANVAVDEQQGDADEGDEGDTDAEYQEQDDDVLYAGPPGNFRGRGGWRRGRSRYGSRFAGEANANSTRTNNEQLNKDPLRVPINKAPLHQRRLPPPQDRPMRNNRNLLM